MCYIFCIKKKKKKKENTKEPSQLTKGKIDPYQQTRNGGMVGCLSFQGGMIGQGGGYHPTSKIHVFYNTSKITHSYAR